MKSLFATIQNIYSNDRRILWWIAGLVLMGAGLVVNTLFSLEFGQADGMIVRYSDTVGYERGGWVYMLGFAGMGVVLGLLHPLVAVRIYEKRGGSVTVMFVVVSMMLVALASLTLMRLVGEG